VILPQSLHISLNFLPQSVALKSSAHPNFFPLSFFQIMYSRKVREARITQAPVFVIGHPRTGTTHMHNLLNLDERFYAPNTFQVCFA
jgi:hypothetical protein